MKVLVTGATGLVGSEVFRKLNDLGHEVLGTSSSSGFGEFIEIDLSSASQVNEKLKPLKVEAIVHCASKLPIGITPESSAIINKHIDKNILDLATFVNSKLIYMSGISVTVEDDIYKTNPYIREKAESEKRYLSNLKDLLVFRLSSPYGKNLKNQNVFKTFIERAAKNEDILVYGSGSRTQDFIHVSDIADLVARSLNTKHVGIYNVGSGEETSMLSLAKIIIENLNSCSEVKCVGSDVQEDLRFPVDISKTKKDFNWQPQISLMEGIILMRSN